LILAKQRKGKSELEREKKMKEWGRKKEEGEKGIKR
jgi:hypothetical protein